MKNEKFDLIETPDGSLALYISEGVNSPADLGADLGYDAEFDRATAIHFPASMEEIPADLQWHFMNLEEYHVHPENPYADDPYDMRCVSFSPNGDVLGGNIYRQDIMTVVKDYYPHE